MTMRDALRLLSRLRYWLHDTDRYYLLTVYHHDNRNICTSEHNSCSNRSSDTNRDVTITARVIVCECHGLLVCDYARDKISTVCGT